MTRKKNVSRGAQQALPVLPPSAGTTSQPAAPQPSAPAPLPFPNDTMAPAADPMDQLYTVDSPRSLSPARPSSPHPFDTISPSGNEVQPVTGLALSRPSSPALPRSPSPVPAIANAPEAYTVQPLAAPEPSRTASPVVQKSSSPLPAVADVPMGDPLQPKARLAGPLPALSVPVALANPAVKSTVPVAGKGQIAHSEDKIARVRVLPANKEYNPLLYVDSEVDRIASLIGLAMMGVVPDGSKMKRHPSFYAPETPMMATSQWTPSALTSYVPTLVAKRLVGLNRSNNEDSKEDLGFFDHCIAHVRNLTLGFGETDEEMIRFWRAVKMGIQALKREYHSSPSQPLPKHVAEKWGIDGWKETMTYEDMFDRWIKAVKEFYNKSREKHPVPSMPLAEIYLPDEITVSLARLLQAAEQVQAAGRDSGNTVSDLKKLVASVLATGRVPEKLHPLSEKAGPLWPKSLIVKNIQDIEKIGRERTPKVQQQKIEKLIREIEVVANQYAGIVRQELCEVMSL